jgi:propanol-preferring alcohol dehydrogenase
VIDARAPDAAKQILKLTGGGAKGAIDFVGGPQTVKLGMDAIARGGKLAIVGLFGGELMMSLPTFPFRAVGVVGSYVGNLAEMHELMALVRTGKVKPVPYATRPLDEVNTALDALKAGTVTGRTVVVH